MKGVVILLVLMLSACRADDYSTAPPTGSCEEGEIHIDCVPSKSMGCRHGTHEYSCQNGKWRLVWQGPGKPGQTEIPVPLKIEPTPPTLSEWTGNGSVKK